jgi:hypothetical protein
MTIKVLLETDCSGCKATLEAVRAAVAEQGGDITVEPITDVKTILSYKVWRMPAIVVDEKVVSVGKNLNLEQARKLLF